MTKINSWQVEVYTRETGWGTVGVWKDGMIVPYPWHVSRTLEEAIVEMIDFERLHPTELRIHNPLTKEVIPMVAL